MNSTGLRVKYSQLLQFLPLILQNNYYMHDTHVMLRILTPIYIRSQLTSMTEL